MGRRWNSFKDKIKRWSKRIIIGIVVTSITTAVLVFTGISGPTELNFYIILASVLVGTAVTYFLRKFIRVRRERRRARKGTVVAAKPIPKSDYAGKTIALFGVWIMAAFMYAIFKLTTMSEAQFRGWIWYMGFSIGSMGALIGLAYVLHKRDKLKEILMLNTDQTTRGIFLWFFVVVLFLFVIYWKLGYLISFMSTEEAIWQGLIVVPSELFIFIPVLSVFYMEVVGIKNRLLVCTLTQGTFALAHLPAYNFNLILVGFAFGIGFIWWHMWLGGKTNWFLGLGSVAGFHFAWNWATGSVIRTSVFNEWYDQLLSINLSTGATPEQILGVVLVIVATIALVLGIRYFIKRLKRKSEN